MELYSLNSLFFILLFPIVLCSYGPRDASLYSEDDPLWQLDSTNYNQVVYGQSHAWIIEFYNNWCGHCVRFAPVWKQFARETKTWNKIIEVGAINCNDRKNLDLCRHYEVDSFPTIKLFWRNTNVSDQGVPTGASTDISDMENDIIDFLESHWDEGVPPDWPDIKVLKARSLQEITTTMREPKQFTNIFVEFPDSYIGRKVILDLSYQKSTSIMRVLTESDTLMRDLGVIVSNETIPRFLRVFRNSTVLPLFSFSRDQNDSIVRDRIFENLTGGTRSKTVVEVKQKPDDTKLTIIDAVYRADLENALYHALHQEIGVNKNIRGEEMSALKAFLKTLRSYFPGTQPTLNFLTRLYNWIAYRKSVKGEEFVQAIENLQTENEYLPVREDFVGCKGSEAKYRGYPCALWTLFHTLTVEADTRTSEKAPAENNGEVLFVIRDYVKHFFTCRECSDHFLHMASHLESEVSNSRDAVLWLWEAHNKVNWRLAGDVTEDPKYPKIQFPSALVCPHCRTRNQDTGEAAWDKPLVLRYLHKFYNKTNILDLEYVRLKYMVTANESLKLKNTGTALQMYLDPIAVSMVFAVTFISKYMKM